MPRLHCAALSPCSAASRYEWAASSSLWPTPQSFLKTEGKIVLAATVEIKGIDRKGMNFDVAKVITDELDINIHRVTVTADEGIFDDSIELRVHDRSDVKLIMDRLKKVDGIQEVMRIN